METDSEEAMKKLLTLILLLGRWDPSAAATIGGVAGLSAGMTGQDPWTWVIGGFGAAVVFVKRPAPSKLDAVVNSMISVCVAGLVSPSLALYVANHVDPALGNPHPIAFILSSLWPWLMPIALSKLKKFKSEN